MEADQPLDLSHIPGLGPVRRAALAEAGVNDLESLLAMSVAELAAVRGIGVWQARKIREHLRQRGLLLEIEEAGGPGAVVLVEPQTPEEAEVLSESMEALEAQAAVEAAMEAEVERLTEAVAQARGEGTDGQEPKGEGGSMKAEGSGQEADGGYGAGVGIPVSVLVSKPQGTEEPSAVGLQVSAAEAEAADADGTEPEDESPEDEWKRRVSEQREQLPEAALALMEAIRQASVAPQLTRQMTRLLITTSEFVSDTRPLSDQQRKRASETLARAEQALQQAVEKRTFSQTAQRDLARRIRRRRKDLEQLLDNK